MGNARNMRGKRLRIHRQARRGAATRTRLATRVAAEG